VTASEEISYELRGTLSPQQERDVWEFIQPYSTSITVNIKTGRMVRFGIDPRKQFWYELAVAEAIYGYGEDDE
jgi:hypothetical protein